MVLECTLKIAHCTLHIAHWTLYTAHSTLNTTHYILPTTHCKLHTAHCILHSAHWTLDIAHCTLQYHECVSDTDAAVAPLSAIHSPLLEAVQYRGCVVLLYRDCILLEGLLWVCMLYYRRGCISASTVLLSVFSPFTARFYLGSKFTLLPPMAIDRGARNIYLCSIVNCKNRLSIVLYFISQLTFS